VISRYFVIVLAIAAGAYRASQGAWVEATGLMGLGAGLVALKLSATRPALRPVGYLAFVVTALAIGVVLVRRYF
jgi:hypothetical protein